MLKELKLTNFRKVASETLDFAPGITVLRGVNEVGKTTRLESWLYALYGSRALRTSFEDTVRWGENPRSLKVEATMEVDGEAFTFVRSKAGAEVIRDGQVFVTGQTEVTNFATKLMGADAATATHLMMATQTNMRGALEQGSRATSELVEGLAEFDFFDFLLERMQTRLVLGSDVSARQRLDDARSRLENLTAERPDTSEWETIVEKAPAVLHQLQELIDLQYSPEYDKARQALDAAKNNRSTYDLLQNNLKRVKSALDEAKTKHIAAQRRAAPVDTSEIKALQAQLDGAADRQAQRKAYKDMCSLIATYPDSFWEGDEASLQAEIKAVQQKRDAGRKGLEDMRHQVEQAKVGINHLEAQIQRDDHCHACGQLLQDHKEIAQRNAAFEAQIKQMQADLGALTKSCKTHHTSVGLLESELDQLQEVLAQSTPFNAFIRMHARYLQVDDQSVPARLQWKGQPPAQGDDVDEQALHDEISEIESAAQASQQAQADMKALAQSITQYQEQEREYTEQVKGYDVVNLDAYQKKCNEAYQNLFGTQQQIQRLEQEVNEARHQIELAQQSYAQKKAHIEEMQARVTQGEKEIEDLGFNNALLRKVRASRGPVTDKLWNMVLASVSTMFTQMRGEHSVVTKGKDGFLVNGETITSLSGSTLDILGIAIRCALTKTFLPNNSLLILDEPASACDSERTSLLLGFLSTAGFSQIILITHEDVSSHIADNLITL